MNQAIEEKLATLYEADAYYERCVLALRQAKTLTPDVIEGLAVQREDALRQVSRATNDLLAEYRWQLRMREGYVNE